MAQEIRVPDIGDFEAVEIIEVLVAAGDTVAAEQSLLTLESDKATLEIPAPAAGRIASLEVGVGDRVSEGDLIGTLEPAAGEGEGDGGDAAASAAGNEAGTPARRQAEAPEPAGASAAGAGTEAREPTGAAPPAAAQAPAAAPGSEDERPAGEPRGPRQPPVSFDASRVLPEEVPHASPAVRRFARELGVDLGQVEGSGRHKRILRSDVEDFVKAHMQRPGATPAGDGAGRRLLPWPEVDFSRFGPVEEETLSRIQRISAANLARNWAVIPHVTQHDEADITEMEAFRKAHGEEAQRQGFKLTPLAFLIKGAVAALEAFPRFNASLAPDGETLVLKRYFHIGVAVDTPDGLVVPVIRDCDRKSLLELAGEVVAASERAREGRLSPADLQGGCFTISSLGGIGGTAFTPIVNAPEVAILGVSRSRTQPVWNGSEFEPRLVLPLSLSYDHRVIDGALAARFTRYLAERLEDIRRLLL